jgi:hypothetical protein
MKPMCIILSFAILFAGCYTHTTVTKDTQTCDGELIFRLHDGTCIFSREYKRVDNGYAVVGKVVNKNNTKREDFSGIVSDEQIKEIVTNELSIGLSVPWVILTGAVFALIVIVAFVPHPRGYGGL